MDIKIKYLGKTNYYDTWQAMKNFIHGTPDHNEIWVTEHYPIYTTGLNKKNYSIPKSKIPHLFVDRGGKITYHGPGQLIIYILFNLSKKKISIRELVSTLENTVIEFLKKESIEGYSDRNAPGVYINGEKIASVGLRFKNKYIYHGLSLNIDMDLEPFNFIDPCGYKNLKVTQLVEFKKGYNLKNVGKEITEILILNLKKNEKRSKRKL